MRMVVSGLVLLLLVLFGALPAVAGQRTLEGEVTYREPIPLPVAATLRVHLIDDDGRVLVEAEAEIATTGEVPLTFSLQFDDRLIIAGGSYALVAEIASGDEVWFRNAQPYALDPLAPLQPILIVTAFTGRLIQAPADTPPAILDVTWRAESIGGTPVLERSQTTLSISGDMRSGGRGGCNSYFAQAELDGERLRFSAVAATRMACPDPSLADQEARFFAALASTRYFRLREGHLLLLNATGQELAVLREQLR